ncbi:MAG: hypothetical protein HY282_17970 [Nitrospirae bacterium]|nr:hypothetical protein [Candidatus Manganitrophaceae bacterium]
MKNVLDKVVYKIEKVVEVDCNQTLKIMTARWYNLGPHEYMRPCINAEIDCTRKKLANALIVDTSQATGVFSQEDQQWLAEYAIPELAKAGLKAVITVLPKKAGTLLATMRWKRNGSQSGTDYLEADSLQTALDLAKKYTK